MPPGSLTAIIFAAMMMMVVTIAGTGYNAGRKADGQQ
jgi:hypothetical protein